MKAGRAALLAALAFASCGPDTGDLLLGKWEYAGGAFSMEYFDNGNLETRVLGKSEIGKYYLLDGGRIRMTAWHGPEIIYDIRIEGDFLFLTRSGKTMTLRRAGSSAPFPEGTRNDPPTK